MKTRGGLGPDGSLALSTRKLWAPLSHRDGLTLSAPLLAALAYAIGFVATLPALLAAVYESSDTAIAPYLSELWLRAPPGSQLMMGHAPFVLGYWIFRFLRVFPDYHETWQLAPWLLSAAGCAAAGWSAARVAGRTAGLLVTSVLICAGSYLLQLQFSWSVHGLAYVNILLLAAFLIWIWSERARQLWVGLASLAVAVLTATGVATDSIVVVGGLVPFVIVGAPVAWAAARAGRWRVATALVAVVVGSLAGAVAVRAVMAAQGFHSDAYPAGVAGLSQLPSHVWLLIQAVYSLLGGYLHEPATSPTGLLGYVCTAAVTFLAALALAETGSWLRWLSRLRRQPPGPGSKDALDARRLQAGYWSVSAAALSAVYVSTTLATDIWTRRYLVTIAYGLLVLGVCRGVKLGGRSQLLTGAAVFVLILTGALAVFHDTLPKLQVGGPTPAMAGQLRRLADQERVSAIYTGYWDSYALGWLGSVSVPIQPVYSYGNTLRPGVTVGSGEAGILLKPSPGSSGRSLLLLDSGLDSASGLANTPPSVLGAPVTHVRLDARLSAYVYGYNISARFGP